MKTGFLSVFLFMIMLGGTTHLFAQSDGTACEFANPFCSDSSYFFENISDDDGIPDGPVGPDYGCLGSEPNPIWYYMQIGTAGTIELTITQTSSITGNGIDADFALWGPFTSLEDGCVQVMSGTVAPLQCSYDGGGAPEIVGLGLPGGSGVGVGGTPVPPGGTTPPAAQVGEVYIMILTNWNGDPGTFTFEQTDGTGAADCGIVCGLTASNSGDVCENQGVTLTASANNDQTTFTFYWTGPGNFSATGQSVTVFPPVGTNTYEVMSVSAEGDTCHANTSVTVHPLPSVILADSSDKDLCNVQDYGLSIINASAFADYQWYKDGLPVPGANGNILNITDSGTYYVVGTTDFGCNDTSGTAHITFNFINADFDHSLNKGCNGDTVNFNNLSDPGTYIWDYGDGSPIDTGTVNPSHFYAVQDVYAVKLKAWDTLSGCIDSLTISVDTRHPFNAAFGMSTDSVCQSSLNTVTFFDQSTGDLDAWFWDFGDGGSSNIQAAAHQYTDAGTFTVMLVVKEAGLPCYDTAYAIVFVDSTPHLTLFTDRDTICIGERANFSLDYLNTATKITWDFGDGSGHEGLDNNIYHAYDADGSFVVTVTTAHPVCPDVVDYDTILVNPYPVINLGPDTSLCLNGAPFEIQSLVNATQPGIEWTWNTGDSTPVIKIVHPGIYSVSANLNGCITTDDLEVKKDCYADIPNVFSPNSDGINDYFFPRQLLTEGVNGFSMVLFNRWGEKVFETVSIDGRGWDGRLNGKDQPAGVYIYQIEIAYKNGTREKYQGNISLLR